MGIAVNANDKFHVAYAAINESYPPKEGNGKYHIYYTKLDNSGDPLIPGSQLTLQDAFMRSPDLALDQNARAHIIWADARDWDSPYDPISAKYTTVRTCLDDTDADGDGYTVPQGDCNDNDPNTYPGAPEPCDGLDNDCDIIVPADETDTDADGYRICEGDCNDDSGINPGACDIKGNGIDEDCDGADRQTGKPCGGDSG